MLIVALHTAAVDNPLSSILSCRTPLVIDNVVDHCQWCQHEGVRGIVVRAVKEEEVRAIVLHHQVLIQPRVDDGGRRSGTTLVGLRGRQHQAGEGGGVDAEPRGRQ